VQLASGVPAPVQQVPLEHSKALLQTLPVAFSVVAQTGVAGTVSQYAPAAQPTLVPEGAVPVTLQEVPQVVASAQTKLPGQAAAVPGVQVCVPVSHVSADVSVEPEQLAPPQSAAELHSTHPAVALQTSPVAAQSVVVPVEQEPEPLQVPALVNWLPAQPAALQVVLDVGYMHAPAASQPVAPQVPVPGQAALQQLPVPLVPQTPEVHWLLLVHAPVACFGTQAPPEQ
jgi:hypothetical protein